MKQHILSCLAAALLPTAAGCVRDFTEAPTYDDTDGKVTLRVGLNIPDAQPLATRAFLDDVPERPDVAYLETLKYYLFVFEDNGSPQTNYLRELVYGSDIRDLKVEESHDHVYTNPAGNKSLVTFTARLDGTAENAIIHIVATDDPGFEEQLKYVPDRSEFGIFTGANGLYTSSKEAYWRRVELDRPITIENKQAVQEQLSHVNMVRNVSRVTLKISDNAEDVRNFKPEAFVVVNSIDLGYVAAYNENLGNDNQPGFVDFEAKAKSEPYDYLGTQRTYRDLTDTEQYVPSRHPASNRQYADDNTAWTAAFEGESSENNPESNMLPKYMFERAVQSEHHTFVLVKGHYGDRISEKRYIKLDIGTKNTEGANADIPGYGIFERYHLIRNFSYDITITKIKKNDLGHTSAESALGAPPANNISTSVETQPLTDINDGVDRMMVNQTTVVIVDKDDPDNPGGLLPNPGTFDMKWFYETDINPVTLTNGTLASEQVKWNYPGSAFAFEGGKDPDGIIASWIGRSESVSTATPQNTSEGNDSRSFDNGWRGFTLYFNTPDDVTRQKTVRLYKPNGLTRDITFISHKRWEFVDRRPDEEFKDWNVEVFPGSYSYDNNTMPYESLDEMREAFKGYSDYQDADFSQVGSQRGAQMTLVFELPADLPEAIFPLDFTIGADRQNIENAYVGNAVVTWGTSLFEGDPDAIGVMRMQFVKTVTWDYYQKHKLVCVRFLTTTDVLNDADDNVVNGSVVKDEDGNVTAQTRIRVTNPYFKPGNDQFERSSHQDVIDPTRTRWHWNFTYPEWSTYFSTYYQTPGVEDPYTLNNLWFNKNYEKTDANGGLNIRIGTGSAEDPAFTFPVDIASDKFSGTLTVTAWANSRNHGTRHGTHTDYDIYNRDIYARIYYTVEENGQTVEKFSDVGPKDCNATGGEYQNQNLQAVQFPLSEFNIPSGENVKVTKFVIWSTKDNATYSEQWKLQEGATNYRDILLLLNQ